MKYIKIEKKVTIYIVFTMSARMFSALPPMFEQEILYGLFTNELQVITAVSPENNTQTIQHVLVQQEKVEQQMLEGKYKYLFEQVGYIFCPSRYSYILNKIGITYNYCIRYPDAIRLYQESKLYYLASMHRSITPDMMRDVFIEKWMKLYPDTKLKCLKIDVQLADAAMTVLCGKSFRPQHILEMKRMNEKTVPLRNELAFVEEDFAHIEMQDLPPPHLLSLAFM